MKEYGVTAYYSSIVRVEADNEDEAIMKAQLELRNRNVALVADNFEVECLDDEEDEEDE